MLSQHTREEIQSQPQVWRQAVEVAKGEHAAQVMPKAGEKVAVIGCGTSWFMAAAYAQLRERGGQGLTDAYTAEEFLENREYDRLVFLSRSGTTSEIISLASRTSVPSVLITAVGEGPVTPHVDGEIVLDFADETSVVQTRFATSALMFMRASLGEELDGVISDCEKALEAEIPAEAVKADQITFLGTHWTIGLATEAALKMRESSQFWTESYPAMEYRHGPIAIAQEGRVVWIFGPVPEGLEKQITATGASVHHSELDPLADLVLLHRVAVARCDELGINADVPRNLSRSVILDDDAK